MTQKTTRRRVLVGIGTGTAVGLAGCTGGSGTSGGGNGSDGNSGSGGNSSGSGNTQNGGSSAGSAEGGPLSADGSSTVYPITSDGSAVWNSNPPADDEEYWGPDQYGFDTDKPMAEFFAGIYGLDPYQVNVGLSHSGVGIEKVMNGQVDIGDSSAPVQEELPERDSYKKFKNHVVGVDGQPVVVSKAVYDAGVTKLTGDQLKAIYKGETTKWQNVEGYSGPDKEIQAICRAEGSGTDTAFRANLFGSPDASIACDSRIGQNQQVRTTVQQSDNAIAYIADAFVGGQAPAVALELNGTTYERGKNLGAKEYPLSRDLHCYTWEGTSKKEAAFINMLITEYGQQKFVKANGYFTLPPDRRKTQRDKLPEPNQQINYGAGGGSGSSNNSSG